MKQHWIVSYEYEDGSQYSEGYGTLAEARGAAHFEASAGRAATVYEAILYCEPVTSVEVSDLRPPKVNGITHESEG